MSPPVHTGPGLRHDALFYDSDEQLFQSTVPFIREGVERDELVLVDTADHQLTALLMALFADEAKVVFANEPGYVKPVTAIDAYKRTIDRGLAEGVPGFRTVGSIDFDESPVPWTEWVRYEAAVNEVFAQYPLTALCLHDTRAVAPEVITGLRRAHPGVVEGHEVVENPEYVEAAELFSEPAFMLLLDPLQQEPAQIEIEPDADVRELRISLYPATIFTAVSRRKVDDFVKAVCEVVANAHAHGQGPVVLHLWTAVDRLVCTVTDHGPGIADPLKGYARSIGNATQNSTSTHDGLGLWAARQLCDSLDYQQTDEGFTVRLVTREG